MQGNWLHLIVLVIVVGASVISWIYRQLKEQSEKKRARDQMEARQREMLRTGRDPVQEGGASTEEELRRRELAARREAQLAELRRRAMARQQGSGARGSTAPTARVEGPPVEEARPEPARTAPTMTPVEIRPAERRPTMRPVQAKPVQRPAKQAKARTARPYVPEPEPETHRLVMDEPVARRPVVVVPGVPQSPEEWRRAIIANEILSPALTLREGAAPVPL